MPTQKIRVLSVHQPYADEIVYGDKWNELRTWKTPYRGPIYIHASRWEGSPSQGSPGPGETGAIIGRVQLVDCISAEDLSAVERSFNERRGKLPASLQPLADVLKSVPVSWRHGIDDWNWIVLDPAPLCHPLRATGKLNLWNAEYPEKQLTCEEVPPECGRPRACDYPVLSLPEVEFVPVTRPFHWPCDLLFDFLKESGVNGQRLTGKCLRELATKWKTSAERLLSRLAERPEFERVPRKPQKENWWRIRQEPLEVRRSSGSRRK